MDDIQEKIKKMKLSDLAILVTQTAQLWPGIGDVTGGIDGIYSAFNGITSNGQVLSNFQRSMSSIFGLLGISVVGALFVRGANARKIAEIIDSFSLAKKVLPVRAEQILNTILK